VWYHYLPKERAKTINKEIDDSKIESIKIKKQNKQEKKALKILKKQENITAKISKQTSKKIDDSDMKIMDWIKLDNAALIYPSSASEKWNFVYRVSTYLDQDIDKDILQKALNEVMPRFPHFNVCLRRGFFWYYFQSLSFYPEVQEEKFFPCRIMELSPRKHVFRVLYYKNKLSFEAFHSLSDGFGALMFIMNLLSAYYTIKGEEISLKDFAIDYHDKPSLSELEDPFANVADKKNVRPRKEKRGRRLFGTPLESGKLGVITGIMSLKNVKECSKAIGISITELIISAMYKAMSQSEAPFLVKRTPLKISVPINARAFFPSNTTRNFSSYINLELLPEQESLPLEEMAKVIKEKMKVITKDFVLANINKNVKDQNNFAIRIIPLPLKNLFLKFSYKYVGEGLQSTVFSNLGQVPVPKDLLPHIQRMDAILGASKYNPTVLSGMTVGDTMTLTFSSTIVETEFQKNFFRILSSLGIKIVIDTNLV